MLDFTLEQKEAFVLCFAIIGLILLYVGGRVLASKKKSDSAVINSYGIFNTLVGLGYILFSFFTFIDPSGNSYPLGFLVALPFYYIGVAYLSIFVWEVLYPKKSHNVIFFIFFALAAINIILFAVGLIGGANYRTEASYVAIPMAIFVPLSGALFILAGLKEKQHSKSHFSVGLSLILSSIIAASVVMLNFINPTYGVLLTLALVPIQLIGLRGVLSIHK